MYDALSARFGDDQVFMDLTMDPGVDFVEQINEAVASCRLLIAVIGPRWATVRDAQGRRRLDNPTDFIRLELEAGLRRRDVRVVPVLVQGAAMPSADELPPPLAGLARRNALELSDARWGYDVDRLASAAARVLEAHPHRSVPGGLRGHSRLVVAACVLAVLAGVGAVLVSTGGDADSSPESRLLELIPTGVREAGCRRARGEEFWMKSGGAVAQYDCELPTNVVAEGVRGGGLAYALFPSADKAQRFVHADYQDALGDTSKKPRACDPEVAAQLRRDGDGDGDGECYENEDGFTISWSYPDSAVAVQMYLASGTRAEAAVDARAELP